MTSEAVEGLLKAAAVAACAAINYEATERTVELWLLYGKSHNVLC